jgi:hypothetical protein
MRDMAGQAAGIPRFAPGSTPITDQFVFDADGATIQLPDLDIDASITVKAADTNSAAIYMGDPTVTDTGGGIKILPGLSKTYYADQIRNASQLFVSGKEGDWGCFLL